MLCPFAALLYHHPHITLYVYSLLSSLLEYIIKNGKILSFTPQNRIPHAGHIEAQ